jgi:predicted RND superfamily exporter protein
MTSVMLLGGLATMSLSSFVPIRWFAELMAATILFAVIGDLTIIPPLLKKFWPEKPDAVRD